MMRGKLENNRVIVWNLTSSKKYFEKEFYGKLYDDRLELSLLEAAHLLERNKLEIKNNKKKINFNNFIDYCNKTDDRFDIRYTVYKDLRKKELPTRTGFKFGCDFRVYEKGVKPLHKGPKSAKEHTKWLVYSVPNDFKCSYPELSRAVRLAHNIRANMLWATVDKKKKVNYFQVTFFKP